MHMRMKKIQEILITTVESQLGNLDKICTEELGEVVDMIKDLAEAIYYESITTAMDKNEKENSAMAKATPEPSKTK